MDENHEDENEIKNQIDDEENVSDLKESIHKMKHDFKEQIKDLKEELKEVKREYKTENSQRIPRTPQKRKRSHSFRINGDESDEWGDRFGASLEHYIGGIIESIGDTIDRSIGSIFQYPQSKYTRRRKRLQKEPIFVSEEELEEFYEIGSKIMGALSDNTRLRMLKELEKEPLRQSDLSERTNTRGGNFKHHITLLKDEGLVRQEGVRERYMLTFAGREALKLVEFLYSRSKKRISVPIVSSDEEEESDYREEEE